MIRLTAVLACLSLSGCGSAPVAKAQSADLGSEFTLTPGARVSVKSAQMKVRFLGVTEDSRCPKDVTCIWAGEVKVQLEVEVARVASQVEIREGGSRSAGGYHVTLMRVEPQRTSTAQIAPQDYRATVKIVSMD